MASSNAVCPSCGFSNPRVWRACARCGVSLRAAALRTPPPATMVTAPPRFDDEAGPTLPFDTAAIIEGVDSPVITEDYGSEVPASLEIELTQHGGERVGSVQIEMTNGGETAPEPADEEVEPPLVGQAEASQAIRTGIERAFSVGSPTLVSLEGEAESGKTRLLVYASEIAARQEPNVLVLYGACRKGGGDGPYAPFSRMLLERFGVTPASSPATVRGQMATHVSRALMTKDAIQVAETTHLLGHVAGIPFPDSPFLGPLADKPDELRRRAGGAVRRFIEGEGQQHPVLVLLDDMHHVESDGWEIAQELTRSDGHIAIVMAGDAPLGERAEALQVPGGFALGPISPLEEEDVATVLHVLLPDLAEAPAPLVAAITHRSKGNPGAIRQLVFALLETSLFVRDEDTGLRVDLDQLAGGDLPVTLEDAIQLRLDALNAFQRETLARAATVGDRFWDGAILAQMRSERDIPGERTDPTSIWPNDEDLAALHQALTILVERGFVEQQEPSDLPGALEFSFQMSGVRDRTYLTADESLRILRHTAVARWLAVTAELRREGIAALIAPHLEEAGMPRRAGRAYLEAASYERKHLRTSTALRYIEKALPLISSDDVVRKIDAYHEHGSLLSTVGRYDDAIDNFTDMLRLAWGIGARGKGGAALNRIARVHRQRGEVQSAESILTRALSMFRTAGDLRGVAATLDDLAQVYNLLGDSKRALSAGGEALEIRRAHRDKRGEAVSLHTLASIELNRGNLNRCEEFFRQSLTIREEIRDLEGIMQSHNALGILAFERGDKATAAEAWKAALSTAEEMADRRNQSYLLNNIGEAYIAQNRLEDAAASLARARAHATELGDKRALAEIERNLGWVAVKRGGDDAEETLERALRLAKEYGAKDMIAAAYRAIGQLRAQTLFDASGEADLRAEENFLTSIDLYREIGNEKEAARSLASLGFHLIERGEMETAKERLHEARAIMRGMGLAELERVDRTLAELGA